MNANLIGILITLTLISSSFGVGYHMGKQGCESKYQKAVLQTQEKQNQAVQEVQQAQVKREIIFREKIKIVHDAVDDCLDRPVPDSLLRTLRPGP